MRNLMLTIIAIFILYTYFNDKNSLYSEASKKYEEVKKTAEEDKDVKEILKEKDTNQKIESEKEVKTNREYPEEPKNFVERVLTNALSDFMNTPSGMQFTKSMIMPSGMELRNNNIAIITSGYNPIKSMYEIEPVTKNNGNICICGQEVRLNYLVLDEAGKPVDSNFVKYKIGESKIPEFNILVDRLPLGDMIKAKMLSNQALSSIIKANNSSKLMMNVTEQITKHHINQSEIKIFDEYISSSRPILCGDKIKINYEVKNIKNEILTSGQIDFIVGDWSYPTVFTYLMYNMPYIGKRLVILPYKYLDSGEKPIKIDNLHPDDNIFLEFSKPELLENK